MLEVRKNNFSKNYENIYFRNFSQKLAHVFKEKSISGLLIGCPLCEVDERLKIDALLITTNVICIIDFKNYSGKIKLPKENFEFGHWINNNEIFVRGGSTVNPFIQLKNQKSRFIEVYKNYIQNQIIKSDKLNPLHLVRIVCFQEEIELIGEIPNNEKLNFFIIDNTNYIENIIDIIEVEDNEVKLNLESINIFNKIYYAKKYDFTEKIKIEEVEDTSNKTAKQDFDLLYEEQKDVMSKIKLFLESPEERVLILHGSLNCGKTTLIPYIQNMAYTLSIHESEIFGYSNRVARNLMNTSGLENVHSVYSYIYKGFSAEHMIKPKNTGSDIAQNNDELENESLIEIIPLKSCDNSEKSLFIVDEAQLISDTYFESNDLVFGTGYLLKDLISFTNFSSSNRKIIFIGDPFLLIQGTSDNSSLNQKYVEQTYKLATSLINLADKENYSNINKQALNCIKSIKSTKYNNLSFKISEQIEILETDKVLDKIKNVVDDKLDCHILSYTNQESQKLNLWIKKSILKNSENIAPGDLIVFNNIFNVEYEEYPFTIIKTIFNGQFANVVSVEKEIISESIKIGDNQTILTFREIVLQLIETGDTIRALSLENYRLNTDKNLLDDIRTCYRILLNIELNKNYKLFPFEASSDYKILCETENYKKLQNEINKLTIKEKNSEKVKTILKEKEIELRKLIREAKLVYKQKIENKLQKNSSSKYYKYKNVALLKFGWAMTVHKSISFKWDEVILNLEPGNNIGKFNESYFRWVYTGLSRAKKKLSLFNYTPITPFSKTIFDDKNINKKPQDILYHAQSENKDSCLEEFKNFINSKISKVQYNISNIEHFNWQERYFFNNGTKDGFVLAFSYNGNGYFKLPTFIGGNTDLSKNLISVLSEKNKIILFDDIKDKWRKKLYEVLNNRLSDIGIYFELIEQSNYKDKIRFFSTDNELEIELDYDGEGFVTHIKAKYYNNKIIWEQFNNTLIKLKE